jgi:predicted nuclease of predicted toxin-antitoxin system
VKLLFDENLSPSLIRALVDVFPGSAHVRDFGLKSSTDLEIWTFAAQKDYVIVSKDADFRQRSFVFGAPPKVIWIRLENCSTTRIADLLRDQHSQIRAFCTDPQAAFLSLG